MDASSMLDYLSMVANKNLGLNMAAHLAVIVAIASLYLLKDLKVKKYIFNGTILALFLSVTVNAIIYGNPFHVLTFGILAVMAAVELIRGKNQVDTPKKSINTIIAYGFVFIGLWYPEFSDSMFKALLLSPVGMLPCPTLITVLGMLNLYSPNISKLQFVVTVLLGTVYGVIGTFRFGVYLDVWLIVIVIYSIYKMIFTRKCLLG